MSKQEGGFATLLRRLAAGDQLSAAESAEAFGAMMAGAVSETRMAAFLTALAVRGPTVAEITGAARAMRQAMTMVDAPADAIDVCGTGGDGAGTLNVSTAAAFVVVACGVPVAKHGNRAMSSRTGAADVLEYLGVPIINDAAAAKKSLIKPGFAFLFAPAYHPAMKHVAPVRKELGFRTMFNLLGPLCNPAGVRRQLMGIFASEWLEPVAYVLAELGAEKAWIVHGADGLDEMSTTGITRIAVLEHGHVDLREIAPEDAGLKRSSLSALKGGTAEENGRAIREIFAGAKNAFRDIVLLNAGAALVVADRAQTIAEGVALAAEALDKGRAAAALEQSRISERAGA
ncbi:MAG: anthranilate phosphoribosyltransferase [Alphaproteobacteria bacterium]|jgi:anthranilate phosphoribosyltransferase|nr:anthranilate phosphoribosyltransferase [Alphaproteobacteria bacterium]